MHIDALLPRSIVCSPPTPPSILSISETSTTEEDRLCTSSSMWRVAANAARVYRHRKSVQQPGVRTATATNGHTPEMPVAASPSCCHCEVERSTLIRATTP